MVNFLHTVDANFELLSKVQGRLGCDSSVEGRISKVFLDVTKPVLLESYLFLSIEMWGTSSIRKLLELTHKQWKFRNSKVHYGRLDGLTKEEHLQIIQPVEDILKTPSVSRSLVIVIC